MSLSAYGRLLLMGIWTESFDDGVFEWKPLTLKARIFPVDAVDVNDLLIELVNANLIARIESHPKKPGVIRNFQRYQRPKKPNSSGMLSEDWLDYVGAKAPAETSDDDSSEPVRNQFGTSSEKSPQMEEGGGKGTSSLRSEVEKKERERKDFDSWFSSWPSQASDDEDDAFGAWCELSAEDRSDATRLSSAYVEQAKGGGRTTICCAAKYLRKRMWKRVREKPPGSSPPKANSITTATRYQTREEYLAAELRRSERSFQ